MSENERESLTRHSFARRDFFHQTLDHLITAKMLHYYLYVCSCLHWRERAKAPPSLAVRPTPGSETVNE